MPPRLSFDYPVQLSLSSEKCPLWTLPPPRGLRKASREGNTSPGLVPRSSRSGTTRGQGWTIGSQSPRPRPPLGGRLVVLSRCDRVSGIRGEARGVTARRAGRAEPHTVDGPCNMDSPIPGLVSPDPGTTVHAELEVPALPVHPWKCMNGAVHKRLRGLRD